MILNPKLTLKLEIFKIPMDHFLNKLKFVKSGETTRFSLTEGAAPLFEGGPPGAPDPFSAWRTQPIQWDVTSRH